LDFETGFPILGTPKTSGVLTAIGASSGIPNARSTTPIPPELHGFHAPGPLENLSPTDPTPRIRELPRRSLDPRDRPTVPQDTHPTPGKKSQGSRRMESKYKRYIRDNQTVTASSLG